MGYYGIIDIGTNTTRLLIAEIDEYKRLKVIARDRAIPRLGGGFTPDTGISQEAHKRALEVLRAFSKRLSDYPIRRIRVVGTSILRRARNRKRFIDDVKRETDLEIEVISGEEEGELSLKGVLTVIGDKGRGVVMDIGGGSTEFIFWDRGIKRGCWSIELGVVSLVERFLSSDPPFRDELEVMEQEIEGMIGRVFKKALQEGVIETRGGEGLSFLAGTAGTPTTLSAIDQSIGVDEYTPERINGYILGYERVKELYKKLSSMPLKERKRIRGLETGREDVIIPGTSIIIKTMEIFGFKEMVVSDAGLLEGAVLKLWEEEAALPCLKKGGRL